MRNGARSTENQKIAGRLKTLRAERGNPSQKVVAIAMGVAPRSYQNWELGTVSPTHTNAQKIASYYETTTDYILHGLEGTFGDATARQELAAINDKLDRILKMLTAGAAEGIMDELRAALLGDAERPPAVQAPRPPTRSGASKGHPRA